MKIIILIIPLLLIFNSCNNSSDNKNMNEISDKKIENDIKMKELELKERELNLKEKELDMQRELSDKLIEDENKLKTNKEADELNYFPGLFPHASKGYLGDEDLYDLSPWQLKIMRNEIFARHGYIFQSDDMISYFFSQSWYNPRYANVNDMLSKIEQANIGLITRFEK